MKNLYQPLKKGKLWTCMSGKFFLVLLVLWAGWSPQLARAGMVNLFSQVSAVTVSGNVTDDTGEPLPGVNILEKGTSNGTITDVQGNFRITVNSSESVLIFSYVGTITQEIV